MQSPEVKEQASRERLEGSTGQDGPPRALAAEEAALLGIVDKTWHDINNLLMIILGNAEQIADEGGSEIGEMAGTIVESAEQCSLLNRRLLVATHRLVLRPESVAVDGLLSGLQHLLNPGSPRTALELQAGSARCLADKIILETTILDLLAELREGATEAEPVGIVTRRVDGGNHRQVSIRLWRAGPVPHSWLRYSEAGTEGQDGRPIPGSPLEFAESFARRSGGELTMRVDAAGVEVEILLPQQPVDDVLEGAQPPALDH